MPGGVVSPEAGLGVGARPDRGQWPERSGHGEERGVARVYPWKHGRDP